MTQKKKKSVFESISNSLSSFCSSFGGNSNVAQNNKTDTQQLRLRRNLISNDRSTLSWMYIQMGVVQTLVDQPVDDAFREGFIIKTSQISEDEIRQIESLIERDNTVESIKTALKWARLFGGGAIIILTDQKPDTPLDKEKLQEGGNLSFKSADMWELLGEKPAYDGSGYIEPEYYMYYGKRIHKSRIYRIEGKRPPSFMRGQLRGWGVSVVERALASLNQYSKNQSVIFDLVDEAKIDIYKIDGFNSALLTENGTNGVTARVQMSNQLKNYNNAIVMDKNDEYEQKQMNFAGLAELRKQNKEDIAADLRIPMTKLFGVSSAGFNSGEDDIENYNAMVESEIRSQIKYAVTDIVSLVIMNELGIEVDDLSIEFPELRIMSTEQAEFAKSNEFNRVISTYQQGIMNAKETKESINKSSLVPIILEEDEITFGGVDGGGYS